MGEQKAHINRKAVTRCYYASTMRFVKKRAGRRHGLPLRAITCIDLYYPGRR